MLHYIESGDTVFVEMPQGLMNIPGYVIASDNRELLVIGGALRPIFPVVRAVPHDRFARGGGVENGRATQILSGAPDLYRADIPMDG